MKYIVLQQHTNDTGLHRQGEEVEYKLGQAKALLEAKIISEPVKAELKEIKKTTKKSK